MMSKKVMVVDDSRIACTQLSKILEDTEYQIVECCRDGESALKTLEGGRPDLITLDIIMPGIDGLDTAKEILKRWPDANIVMVSSLAYDETINEAKKIGAKGFIYKPLEKNAVINAFNKVFED